MSTHQSLYQALASLQQQLVDSESLLASRQTAWSSEKSELLHTSQRQLASQDQDQRQVIATLNAKLMEQQRVNGGERDEGGVIVLYHCYRGSHSRFVIVRQS